jgi:hypothetical protein
MILRNNSIITPLIFTLEENKDIKYLELVWPTWKQNINIADSLKFKPELYQYCMRRSKLFHKYLGFYNGLLTVNYELIAMLVKYKEEVYLLLSKKFSENFVTETKRVKRNAEKVGINLKKNIILASNEEIFKTYFQVINPKFEDYNKDNQREVSKKFLQWMKNKIAKEKQVDELPF